MMTTSVIVTTYNRPDALGRVLEGLARQTRPPQEILVADDGSEETTRRCIEKSRRAFQCPVKHVRQTHRGFRVARIRNKAVKICAGEYLIFLDGDCIPEKHFVADHCRLARPGYFTQGKRVLVDEVFTPAFTPETLDRRRLGLMFSPHLGNKHHLLRLAWLPPWPNRRMNGVRSCNMGLYTADLKAVNGFNEAFQGWGREDSELVVRLYKYGLKRQDHAFAAVCYHLWHPANPRHRLDQNERLLARTMASGRHVCEKGLSGHD